MPKELLQGSHSQDEPRAQVPWAFVPGAHFLLITCGDGVWTCLYVGDTQLSSDMIGYVWL